MEVMNEFQRAMKHYKKEAKDDHALEYGITEQEHLQLLSLYKYAERGRVCWRILKDTGMRPAELCFLSITNFNEDLTLCQFQTAKSGKVRLAYISKDLAEEIKAYYASIISPYKFLFPTPNNYYMHPRWLNNEMMRVRKKLYEITGNDRWIKKGKSCYYLHPYSYRIAFVIKMVSSGMNCEETARYLEHSDSSITYGYFKTLQRWKVKKIIEKDNGLNSITFMEEGQKGLKAYT